MSFMRKCCSCYNGKAHQQYESLNRPFQSQFYCCEHSRSTLIKNTKQNDSLNNTEENQENNCNCNHNNKMELEEAVEVTEKTEELFKNIKNTEDFMAVEKGEYCKVWSEHKIRKEWTLENVKVPFDNLLKDPFETGLSIVIQGNVPKKSNTFSVNFIISAEDDDDIALHFNPRFDVNYCVRNSKKNGYWGDEEKAAHIKNPFKQGDDFVLEIFCAPTEFMVAVNGVRFCTFTYRYPLYTISRLQIVPHVDIYKIQTKLLHFYPAAIQDDLVPELKSFQIYPHINLGYEKLEITKESPLVFLLNNNLAKGNMIEICGKVKLLPHTFFINLQHGKLLWPHPNISFHTSVRFKYRGESVHKVVCNSYKNEVWGTEEIPEAECPYDPGRSFTMKIFLKDGHYNVLINDELFINYKYRDDPSLVNTIYISGCVYIQSIQVSK